MITASRGQVGSTIAKISDSRQDHAQVKPDKYLFIY
jgi:hypothetical protein